MLCPTDMFLYVENHFNQQPELVLVKKSFEKPPAYYVEYLGAPLYFLPPDLEAFRAQKRKKYWYNIGRGEKKFREEVGPLEFELLTDAERIRAWLPRVKELFLKRWEDTYTSSEWGRPGGFEKYADALVDLSAAGEGSLAVLYSGERLIAFGYNISKDATFYFYQHAVASDPEFEKYSLGKVFLVKLLETVIALNRYRFFDFMVGEVQYKLEWASCIQKVYYRIDRKDHPGRLSFVAACAGRKIRSYLVRSANLKSFLKGVISWPLRLFKKSESTPSCD